MREFTPHVTTQRGSGDPHACPCHPFTTHARRCVSGSSRKHPCVRHLQVNPNLMGASRLDGHVRHAQLPVKRGCRHNGNRAPCANVRLDGGHRHHALSVVRVPPDRHVDGGPLAGVTDAYHEIRFTDLEGRVKVGTHVNPPPRN